MANAEAVRQYQELKAEFNKPKHDLKKCGQLLDLLKMKLVELASSNSYELFPELAKSKHDILLARDVLEIGTLWSVEMHDIHSFERYMVQLKSYYFDYSDFLSKDASPFRNQLLGLNLLSLLAQNRLAEFHCELELLPSALLLSDVYLRHPVQLEQYLMEGAYNKVFISRGNVPAESYKFFMDYLLRTTRDEIASCMEKGYASMEASETARMLYFTSQQPTEEYAKQRGWKLVGKNYVFQPDQIKVDDVLPSKELALRAITYAVELERII